MINGFAIFEGDIILGNSTEMALGSDDSCKEKRNRCIWPKVSLAAWAGNRYDRIFTT